MTDADIVVVGGGPAGSAVAVFVARYGLDPLVFDCGRSSLKRCAHLENYLGFPGGIDVETFYAMLHDHVERTGGDLVTECVESVERADGEFVVETAAGRRVTVERVVAATRYGGEYLRPLDGDRMFETVVHAGEEHERFDRSYPNRDGTTPVEGLYVASPSTEADRQALVAAGRGARVGLALVRDARLERGYPEAVADHYDWMRRQAAREDGWRDRWRERYDARLGEEDDLDDQRRLDLRERDLDRRQATYLTGPDIEHRRERAHRRLLEHLDDDLVLERARTIERRREPSESA